MKKTWLLPPLLIAVSAGALLWLAFNPRGNPLDDAGAGGERDTYSNIHPGDYVGPETCASCHSDYYEAWKSHPHSKMNLDATAETVLGDFNARLIEYGDGYVVFDQQGDQFLMSLYREGQLSRQYRVTRTVGSRYTQMYIGLQTFGPEPARHQAYRIEGKLPFGYWLKRRLWTPVSYFDSAYEPEPENESTKTEELSRSQQEIKWELNCLYCHNTYPYQHRVSFGHGLGFQPEDFRFPEREQSLAKWGVLTPDKLVTLGISCESCHFGGREHVQNGRETRFYPSSPELTLRHAPDAGGAGAAKMMNSICSQCHCATVTPYPNGAATWNSREALDMQSGACQNRIRCTDCHDPHRPGIAGGLPPEPQIAKTCTQCHESLQDETRRAQHTRHAENVTCLDCHMPRIVQGLDSVVRTHHISSPTQESMLRPGGPNACNLCHLDQSLPWTLDELEKGWGVSIPRGGFWTSEYGPALDQPVGKAWLAHRQAVVRLIASDAYARMSPSVAKAPELLEMLNEPYAVNRMFGLFAVERILGRELSEEEYAPLASQAERRRMVEALRDQWTRPESE
jgi:hypothetical protein